MKKTNGFYRNILLVNDFLWGDIDGKGNVFIPFYGSSEIKHLMSQYMKRTPALLWCCSPLMLWWLNIPFA